MGKQELLANLNDLRQKLIFYFDKNELHALCFDLGVDYDNLPESKEAAIRELIRHQIRHQQIERLIEQCRSLRTQVPWPEISSSETAVLLISSPNAAQKLSAKEAKERKLLLILLEKVKKFWIKGVLDKSTMNGKLINLGRKLCPNAVDHPWQEEREKADAPPKTIPTNQNILETFQESDRALLILGEPGAGKTVTLLQLTRELITLAEQDPAQPIPVVLKLASWAENQGTIVDWAVEELSTKYHIPRKISRPWLEKDKLLLLLDGLASVPENQREACVQAINQFRNNHGFSGLVVSSRLQEYEGLNTRLQLGGAILLQNLTAAQIDAYLAEAGSLLAGLRQAIRRDAALQEMAQTPLMLHVMSATYSDLPTEDADDANILIRLPAPAEPNTVSMISQRQQILNGYVQRMFQRCGDTVYSYEQTQRWLSCLAQKMSQHHQSIFQLEQIQPSWLPGRPWRWAYFLLTRSMVGLLLGIILWLVVLMGVEIVFLYSDNGLYYWVADQVHGTFLWGALFTWIIFNTLIGLLVALVDIYLYERSSTLASAVEYYNGRRKWFVAGMGTTIFLLTNLVFLLRDSLQFAILVGLINAFAWTITSVVGLFRTTYHSDIHLIEALQWSGKDALQRLPLSLVFGLGMGVVFRPFVDSSTSWAFGGLNSLFIIFYSGLKPLWLEEDDRPNEGIKISIRNGLFAGMLFFLGFGLFLMLTIHNLRAGFIMGLIAGLGGAFGYGGWETFKHLLVRLLLNWQDQMPLRCVHFLNHAAGMTFMHRVGGGYIFIHRLLQAYFGDLDLAQSGGAKSDLRTALSSSQVL